MKNQVRIRWEWMWGGLFLIQAGINLAGALGPELSFDALWYHLPLSRLAAERGWWGVIPGGLLYYSGLPRLWDWVGAGLLMIGGEILVKVIHWAFGVGSAWLVYKLGRRYFGKKESLMAGVVWYSSLVVGWLSITAYVDLVRTFFILVGVWYFLEAVEKKKKWLWSALVLGVAYSIKAISLVDGVAVGFLFGFLTKNKLNSFKYWGVLSIFVLFWGGVNIMEGYGFFYPFLTGYKFLANYPYFDVGQFLGPLVVFFDPRYRVGPIILILVWIKRRKLKAKKLRPLLIISTGIILAWFLIPRSGFGRFFLPSLALLSVVGTGLEKEIWKRRIVTGLVVLSAVIGIVYRGMANGKFVPYLMGKESKNDFLIKNLNFEFGDWYDTDGWVRKNLTGKRYLVKGVHNTYYLPGDFDHESWADADYCYRYVLVQGEEKGENWTEVHRVEKTKTRIFEDSTCPVW